MAAPERPLTGIGGRAGSEQREAVVEPLADGSGGQHLGAGGRQLDRQRQAIEHPADRRHCLRVRGIDDEVVAHGTCTSVNSCTATLARISSRAAPGGGAPERRHRPRHLPVDAERLPARRQDGEAGATSQQTGRQRGARVDDVLTGVEHERPGWSASLAASASMGSLSDVRPTADATSTRRRQGSAPGPARRATPVGPLLGRGRRRERAGSCPPRRGRCSVTTRLARMSSSTSAIAS